MATQKTRKEIIDAHNAPTAIGSLDGRLDYPSSRGLGIDQVDYWRRNPHPTEHDPLPVKIKMRDLPGLIVNDLTDASNHGQLREELSRHIDLLEQNRLADSGTIDLLRDCWRDCTGHPGCDRDTMLDTITTIVQSLSPSEAK